MDSEGAKRANYVTSWFIRGVKAILSSKTIIPLEISGIILLYIGDHFVLYSTSYTWHIDEELATKMKNCPIGSEFQQKLDVGKSKWIIKAVYYFYI